MRSRVARASRQSSSRRSRSAMYPETDSIRPSSLARRSFSIRSLGRLIASFSVEDIPRLYRSPCGALNLNGKSAGNRALTLLSGAPPARLSGAPAARLSGAPPARRGAGHPSPGWQGGGGADGGVVGGDDHAASRDAGLASPAALLPGSLGWPGPGLW